MVMAAAMAAAVAPVLVAQQSSPALQACRAQTDDARRLACYDRELDAMPRPPAKDSAEPAAATETAMATAEERFGQEGDLARKEREQARNEGRELEELHSKVAAVSARPDGALVITLENGQVWAQKAMEPNFHLRIGEPVRIRRGAVGSFVLNGDSRWSTRVKRLR